MDRVSTVEKARGKIRVVLESGTQYLLLKSVWAERRLEPGQEVDEEELSRWVASRQYKSALEKSVAMLAARACSEGEIRTKLRRTGYAPETADRVIARLRKEGFVNDREFARQWAAGRTGMKYGPRRIAQELGMKGVARTDAEEAVSEIPEEEMLENAVLLARKALSGAKAGEDPRKTRQRITAYVVRRGYDWDTAREACARVLNPEEDEDWPE